MIRPLPFEATLLTAAWLGDGMIAAVGLLAHGSTCVGAHCVNKAAICWATEDGKHRLGWSEDGPKGL